MIKFFGFLSKIRMYLIGAAAIAAISSASYFYVTGLNATIDQLKSNNQSLVAEVGDLKSTVEAEKHQRERELNAIRESVRVYIEAQNRNKENMDKLKKLIDENKEQNEDFEKAMDHTLPNSVVDSLYNFN